MRAYAAIPGTATTEGYALASSGMDVWANPWPVTVQARVAQASGVADPAVPR